MSNRKLVRRPEWDLHSSGSATDPSNDWRRFVLDQVGYDEVERDRAARRAEHRRTVRRFVGGVALGLIVFALAFALALVVRFWREGRFDRYLPQPNEAAEEPIPHRRARAGPADVTESHDIHVIQQYPFASPPHTAAPPVVPDDDGPAQVETTLAGDES